MLYGQPGLIAGMGTNSRQKFDPEEYINEEKIRKAEERERQKFVKDIISLMSEFKSYGVTADTAAQLAGMFYSDPDIRKRRTTRRTKKEKS